MVFALILVLIIAILAVFFALENTMLVTISFFGYAVDGSLALFILIALGIGVLVGVLIMTPGRIKSGLSNRRNTKKISSLEANLDEERIKRTAMEKLVESSSPPEFKELEEN
jgi:uncharacterized membrane protein YciS (DUF1049 family)